MKSEELRATLAQFIGTENWYRHPLSKMTYTDGVRFFAHHAGAWWLVDILATQPEITQAPFSMVTLHVDGSAARLVATDGDDHVLYRRDIAFTDCPEGQWEFYVTDGVILLTSEY